MKTNTLERLDEKMGAIDKDSVRYTVLQAAKDFKSSWVALGQALYSVWKDKSYKEWGYITFDAYTQKEIGIKKTTAMKLLKSYYFLEKEEPAYLQKDHSDDSSPAAVPSYEAVNLLRLAKNKNTIDKDDYQRFKKDVLETGKDTGQLKKDLTALIREREELSPEDARQARKIVFVKRVISSLKALKTGMEAQKFLSVGLLKEISGLIAKLESEVS